MVKIRFLLRFWMFLFLHKVCEGYKILVAYPFPARSHNILGNGLVRHLLNADHEVTYITPFPLTNPHPNLRQLDVSKNSFPADAVDIGSMMTRGQGLNDETHRFNLVIDVARQTFQHEHVKKILSDPKEQFDIVIAEWMFNKVYLGLGVIFECPFIWTLPYEPSAVTLRLVDEAPNPAYIPNLGSDNVHPFSFLQRAQELLSQLYSVCLDEFKFYYKEKEIYENSFKEIAAKRGLLLRSFDDVRLNASMILINSHFCIGEIMRLPENIKSIAGYFIESDTKPLPEDIRKIMDNAKHGVIFFSMGSNLKSKELPDSIKRDLWKMFSERKETIIWKFEENYPNLPKNVHIVDWAPQQSVLAHPNCKLLITHGGLLSVTEAMHFGIPMIGIPIYIDQFNNVNNAVLKGHAKRVDMSFTLADDLRVAIEEILRDTKYTNRAKELSMIFHDRPVPPGKELVHWVEHVVKTRGAQHLRSPALHIPWYQKMYMDLAAVVVVILIIIAKIVKSCQSQSKVLMTKKNK